MMKVKSGDIVMIDGNEYVFDAISSQVASQWFVWLERGVKEEEATIHLYTRDGKNDGHFPPSKIKEALEKEDWNKTAHGL